VLLTGEDTAQRYTLIDMHVPTGGGPPPHRHDFEEMFTVLEGEVEVTFRGMRSLLHAGQTINVPANAPHSFRNIATSPARLLCMCIPPGQEEFFLEVGTPVPARTSPPPSNDDRDPAAQLEKALSLAPRYRTELLIP
jgi:quercetin dioxygenase-like cupin family protein